MTEYQDIQVVKRLKTDVFNLIDEFGEWKIYETNKGDFFAICINGEDISFDVVYNNCFESWDIF